MKFVLVATDSRRKNLVFISAGLNPISLKEAASIARTGKVSNAYVVEKKTGAYIRTKPKVPKHEEFESLSISGSALVAYAQGMRHAASTPALGAYIELYNESLKDGQPFITPVGQPKVLIAAVKKKILPYRDFIFTAARMFEVDPYLIGAILIDENARLLPFEGVIDALGVNVLGRNTSIGIAQIKTDTANDLIRKGVYNPNPEDAKLPFKRMNISARAHLYMYLIHPEHNIRFAAASIRFVIDFWLPHVDLSKKPDILGTLYSQGYGTPHSNPTASSRGIQIGTEFYQLARAWLDEAWAWHD